MILLHCSSTVDFTESIGILPAASRQACLAFFSVSCTFGLSAVIWLHADSAMPFAVASVICLA